MMMGMRVSSGASPAGQSGAAAWQQRQQNLKALASALQSGSLDQAKAAYASLSTGNSVGSATNPASPLAQLGKSLQAGDLGAAQRAFASIRPHHGRGDSTRSTSSPSTTSATAGNLLNVVA
jgi:hypothetical protein